MPSGQPDLAEMFHSSVRALQLPDEAALLKALGRGELEAAVDEHDRALAVAPADVQAVTLTSGPPSGKTLRSALT